MYYNIYIFSGIAAVKAFCGVDVSIETEEKTIQKHSDIVKLLKKKLTIRQISGLTNKSTNTILKVKSTAHKLQMI